MKVAEEESEILERSMEKQRKEEKNRTTGTCWAGSQTVVDVLILVLT